MKKNYFEPFIGEPDKERLLAALKREPVDRAPNMEALIEDKIVEYRGLASDLVIEAYHVKNSIVNDNLRLLLGWSDTIKHANEKDYDKVNMIFQPYKKDYFPHLRKDYLQRMIKTGNVVLDKEVVITYNPYKRKNTLSEGVIAEKGDCVLHQIATHVEF